MGTIVDGAWADSFPCLSRAINSNEDVGHNAVARRRARGFLTRVNKLENGISGLTWPSISSKQPEEALTFIAPPLEFNIPDSLLKGLNKLLLATALIASHYVVILEIGQIRVLEQAGLRFRNHQGRGAEHTNLRTKNKLEFS